ncbi:MAG: orotate phosphoribosyltransferase [Pseudomonadota bacterium]|nr:orotate phosphoribosyltransferase [Pseudomonadota bacterium]
MKSEAVLKLFRDSGALLDGHFILSSGLHSRNYLQCARVLMDAKRAARLCKALAGKVKQEINKEIDYVVSPAMGGVIVGYEMGRQLGVPAMFLERENGKFTFRRGFELETIQGRKPRVLMVEDIVTTGLSSKEAISAIRERGGSVVGATCLINRSGGKAKIGVKLLSLADLEIETFRPKNVPADLKSVKAIKPGSRSLGK